jgi:hypothetical protein
MAGYERRHLTCLCLKNAEIMLSSREFRVLGGGRSRDKVVSLLKMTAFWDIAPCSVVEVD